MKRVTIFTCLVLTLAVSVSAQMPDSNAMKNWVTYMTPGKEHKMLASWDGVWSGEITMWMAPGAPPTTSKTTSTNQMLMDGRYQQSVHTGSFGGMPFNGMSWIAFDNAKKVFISTWIDNMGTGIMMGEGPWDEASQSITIKGKMVDPTTGKEIDFREVFKIVDKDNQVMEMYSTDPASGEEFKSMEVKYTRKK